MNQSRGSKDAQLLAHGRATLLALAELVSDEEGCPGRVCEFVCAPQPTRRSTQPAAKRPRAESADEAGPQRGRAPPASAPARWSERRRSAEGEACAK